VVSANTFEIQSSELAKERTESSEVKSFADKMIADHTKSGQDYKSAVQAANVSPPPLKSRTRSRRRRSQNFATHKEVRRIRHI
jgi:predicted outer membrane protein